MFEGKETVIKGRRGSNREGLLMVGGGLEWRKGRLGVKNAQSAGGGGHRGGLGKMVENLRGG